MEYVWIGLGAAFGANARYVIGQVLGRYVGTDFPNGTLLVNITGSVLIGALMTILADRLLTDSHWRLFLFVGVLGGYTTFSSFSFETIAMIEQGRWSSAIMYVITMLAIGLLGCYVGVVIARVTER